MSTFHCPRAPDKGAGDRKHTNKKEGSNTCF